MKNNYLFTVVLILALLASSCKKEHNKPSKGDGATGGLATLGLYQSANGTEKKILMPVTGIGTQTLNYNCLFDTGSAGLVIDAHSILPASMLSNNGISVTGDSVTVNGITVTSQQLTRSYGNKVAGVTEYGNLAYATITIGNQDGHIKTGRIPFFLYYRVFNTNTGQDLPAHNSDVFGVAPGVSRNFGGIGSPLTYLNYGSEFTSGFKLAALNSAAFNAGQTYVPNLLTIGLTDADLTNSGFVMSDFPRGDSSPYIYGDISIDGNTIKAATFEFDTGNPAYSIIVSYAQTGEAILAEGTKIKLSTYGGFNYQYTVGTADNLTNVASPQFIDDVRTNIGIDFFMHNQYMVDYADYKIGLKNN